MGFGAMRITTRSDGSAMDRAEAVSLLRQARELGVNHFDTASFYFSPGGVLEIGNGPRLSANELIREAFAGDEDVVVTTKVGPGFAADGSFYFAEPDQLRHQVEVNLRELGRDHLDVVNLRMGFPVPIEDRFAVLAELREAGLIRHLGVSAVNAEQLAAAQAIAPVVCVQNPYGVDFRRDRNDAFARSCGEQGIAFVPFFAIAGAGKESGAAQKQSSVVEDIARGHGVTAHQIRLAWTLHQGSHVLAIPGTSKPSNLLANVAAGAIQLSETELNLLDGLAS
ncbi:aldo/keto reductase [Longispora albida]|uniref:aldo/keto reductase n=1 Tax=Longispora albida TaxID=203523 RepID=UPI00035F2954